MLKKIFFVLLFSMFIVTCRKTNDVLEDKKLPETCDFLDGKYNTVARMSREEQEEAFRKGGGNSPGRRDTDGDGVRDVNDNCPGTFNPDQADIDGDGKGDACDVVNDDPDKDGVLTAVDNCPNVFNPTQTDTDADGIGDVCDVVPPSDVDGDGVPDTNDNCLNTPNPDQKDVDGDGIGDVCDSFNNTDTDKDSIPDVNDNCPTTPNTDQKDSDSDGIGDVCDPTPILDADGDGVADNIDNCPLNPNSNQMDSDGDGKGDACDPVDPPAVIYSWVIYLDFDGHSVNTVYWNNGIPFYATPSGLSAVEINNIVAEVKKDYASFPITITTDSTIYLKANRFKRQRMVITEYNEWYGGTGGVAYIGGIDWGGGSYSFGEVPGFVFPKALSYNQKYTWEATSHEIGHTLGLYHQIQCSSTGTFLTEYNGGSGSFAPLMGNSYFREGIWWIGPNSLGCTTIQNDSLRIRQKVGF